MRILQVHNRHEGVGGADTVVATEREQLESAGHEVRQVWYGPASQTGLSRPQMAMAAIWNREATRLVNEAVTSFAPDVVHVHTPFPLLSPAIFRATSDVATVTTAHSFRYSCVAGTCRRDSHLCEDCVGSRSKWPAIRHRCYHDSTPGSASLALSLVGHRMIGTFARHVDRYVTLTSFARRLLIRDGFPGERISVKPNAVRDPGPPLPLEQREPYALFVGRLVEEKGIATLLSAWSGLAHDLYLAGDGPLRPLADRAAAVNPRIKILGWVDEATVNDLQRRATLTIVPSEWYEAGPPLVLLDALASGTPVVACDLENVSSRVVEREAGWTFATGDAAGLRAVVHEAWPDREGSAWSVRSQHARALYLSDHTPAASLSTLETIYDQARAHRASGPTANQPSTGAP